MLKKIMTCAAAATILTAGIVAVAPSAYAREGAQSVGGGLKCYWYMGIQYCYKSI